MDLGWGSPEQAHLGVAVKIGERLEEGVPLIKGDSSRASMTMNTRLWRLAIDVCSAELRHGWTSAGLTVPLVQRIHATEERGLSPCELPQEA